MSVPYLLLLHQLGVGAVVDNISAKDRRGQDGVNLLSIDVLELAIENEIVAGRSHCDSGLLSEENKGEYIAMLDRC